MYPKIYTGSYKEVHEEHKNKTQLILTFPARKQFSLYIPPSAIKGLIYLRCLESAVLGAVVSAGEIRCTSQYAYTAGLGSANFMMCLPWDVTTETPTLTTIHSNGELRIRKTSGGTLQILGGPSLITAGEWLNVLLFGPVVDLTNAVIETTFNVVQPHYSNWLSNLSSDPPYVAGSNSRACDFVKIEGCDYPDEPPPEPPPDPEPETLRIELQWFQPTGASATEWTLWFKGSYMVADITFSDAAAQGVYMKKELDVPKEYLGCMISLSAKNEFGESAKSTEIKFSDESNGNVPETPTDLQYTILS